MPQPLRIAPYLYSHHKLFLDYSLGLVLFIVTLPIFIIISFTIFVISGTPVFFIQKRTGLGGKTFSLYKFRTMSRGAAGQQWRYRDLNQADGPVFKITSDPRFVGIGRFLANTGLDELPQLINIFKGQMSLVGPRPLPVREAKKLPRNQFVRHQVKPGITSPWVISGAHNLSFNRWMQLDRQYLKNASLGLDTAILAKTSLLILRSLFASSR